MRADGVEPILDLGRQAVPLTEEEQLLAFEIGRVDGLRHIRQLSGAGGREEEFLPEEWEHVGVGEVNGHGDEHRVQCAFVETLEQFRRLLFGDQEVQVRVLLLDTRHDAGEQVGGQGGEDPELQRAARRGDGSAHGTIQGLHVLEDAACPLDRDDAGGGEVERGAGAVDQLRTQLLLEFADLHRQRGLRHVHGRGSFPEAAMVGRGHEVGEVTEAHQAS